MPQLQARLRASPYEEHRDYVLAVLARRCAWLDGGEREAVLHDAYAVMLEKQRDGRLECDAMHPHQLRAYITQTAIHKALDEGKRAERKRSEPMGERALAEPDSAAAPDELAATRFDSARVREIVDELSERQQTIVKLRFFFDRTPAEIQRYLGISERAYRRELERAMRQVSERYELVREGRYCESRKSLILAFVGGFAGPNRAVEARKHLASCPGCARWAAELRSATDRAAAILPLPPTAAHHGLLSRLSETGASLRDSAGDLLGSAKHHALAVVTRTDPGTASYASVARPGAVVAAVASCVALGSGATYCAVQGLSDPVPGLVSRGQAQPKKDRSQAQRQRSGTKRHRSSSLAQARATVVPVASREPQTTPRRRPRRRTTAKATPAPAPTAAAMEFGLEGSGQQVASGASSGSTAPRRPSSGPPGEFDP